MSPKIQDFISAVKQYPIIEKSKYAVSQGVKFLQTNSKYATGTVLLINAIVAKLLAFEAQRINKAFLRSDRSGKAEDFQAKHGFLGLAAGSVIFVMNEALIKRLIGYKMYRTTNVVISLFTAVYTWTTLQTATKAYINKNNNNNSNDNNNNNTSDKKSDKKQKEANLNSNLEQKDNSRHNTNNNNNYSPNNNDNNNRKYSLNNNNSNSNNNNNIDNDNINRKPLLNNNNRKFSNDPIDLNSKNNFRKNSLNDSHSNPNTPDPLLSNNGTNFNNPTKPLINEILPSTLPHNPNTSSFSPVLTNKNKDLSVIKEELNLNDSTHSIDLSNNSIEATKTPNNSGVYSSQPSANSTPMQINNNNNNNNNDLLSSVNSPSLTPLKNKSQTNVSDLTPQSANSTSKAAKLAPKVDPVDPFLVKRKEEQLRKEKEAELAKQKVAEEKQKAEELKKQKALEEAALKAKEELKEIENDLLSAQQLTASLNPKSPQQDKQPESSLPVNNNNNNNITHEVNEAELAQQKLIDEKEKEKGLKSLAAEFDEASKLGTNNNINNDSVNPLDEEVIQEKKDEVEPVTVDKSTESAENNNNSAE
jgi:hypothetical protein